MPNEPTIQQLFNLSGKTSLVTGGTGHLGHSLCRALAEAGANVIVTSRDQDRPSRRSRTDSHGRLDTSVCNSTTWQRSNWPRTSRSRNRNLARSIFW